MSYLKETGAKFIYRDEEPVGVIVQNGEIKFYSLQEITYGTADELFDIKPISNNQENVWASLLRH